MRDIGRRDALRTLFCSAVGLAALKQTTSALVRAAEPNDQRVAFEWWVPAAEVAIVRNNLRYEGKETPQTDSRGVPVLVIFVGLTLLPYLANAVLALQRQITYGGVVVDTRSEPVKITHDKALDAGVILIIGKDGTKVVERDEITDPAKLVEALGKALKK
jgi:hypothetical protein